MIKKILFAFYTNHVSIKKKKDVQDSSQPKKRVVLTHVQKCQLCLDYKQTPRPTQKEFAIIYKIKQNTVSNILKKKDKWLLVNPDSEEERKTTLFFPSRRGSFIISK